ncbi:hypothetical protein [Roseomonas populi]|uniref:Uncharacterized protein n=1 Tax=Roseomonas populi TaxID=3121582 RepID=A0ABT1WXS1_9PROT|nr:hypothetical protein [Roseomonas pecuniae]MCR0980637.1 hypothetical protein [Roseomonas pecuniae]
MATLKSEGRIPSTPSGRINLPELLAQLYRENADYRQRSAVHGPKQRIVGPLTWEERHPADAMTNVALNTMAFLAPDAVKRAAEQAGITPEAAERLHEVMLTAAAGLRAEAAELCGILRDPDGPEPMKHARLAAAD